MILFKEDLVVNEMQHQILTVRHNILTNEPCRTNHNANFVAQ